MRNSAAVYITGSGSVSALGATRAETFAAYTRGACPLQKGCIGDQLDWTGALSSASETVITNLLAQNPEYGKVDRSVLLAILAARQAFEQAGWDAAPHEIAVNIGSSRGATALFERYFTAFAESGRVPTITSPTTTLGNLSSWVAHDLGAQGAEIGHSVTCSTALQAVANGIAWLKSGMATRFLAGGTEAPLTPFSIAQMKALRIYSEHEGEWPCRPCEHGARASTMLLGEGAAVFALESERAVCAEPLARIEGIALARENSSTAASISENGIALECAMRKALQMMRDPDAVDLVILHAPGTINGDNAELSALSAVFGNTPPVLASNKFLLGHTLGASAGLSLDYALYILKTQRYVPFPYRTRWNNQPEPGSRPIRTVMINAAGFGGNAGSLIVSTISNL